MPVFTTFALPTPRPRLVSGTRLQVSSSPDRPAPARAAAPTLPVRTLSGGYAAALGRPTSALTASAPVFEPRVIRATPARPGEPGCAPAPTSQSSLGRSRRPSFRRQSITTAPSAVPNTPRSAAPPALSSTTPASTAFPRPPYLEHSALRDLLYTDAPPSYPGATHIEHVLASGPGPASSRMNTPVPTPYPYIRRDTTPGPDTDDDSVATASPPPVRATTAPLAPGALLTNPALRLPTRWSEQDRHHLLTVSGDGRELTFYGEVIILLLRCDVLTNSRPIVHW